MRQGLERRPELETDDDLVEGGAQVSIVDLMPRRWAPDVAECRAFPTRAYSCRWWPGVPDRPFRGPVSGAVGDRRRRDSNPWTTLQPSPVFKTGAINHSATPPADGITLSGTSTWVKVPVSRPFPLGATGRLMHGPAGTVAFAGVSAACGFANEHRSLATPHAADRRANAALPAGRRIRTGCHPRRNSPARVDRTGARRVRPPGPPPTVSGPGGRRWAGRARGPSAPGRWQTSRGASGDGPATRPIGTSRVAYSWSGIPDVRWTFLTLTWSIGVAKATAGATAWRSVDPEADRLLGMTRQNAEAERIGERAAVVAHRRQQRWPSRWRHHHVGSVRTP